MGNNPKPHPKAITRKPHQSHPKTDETQPETQRIYITTHNLKPRKNTRNHHPPTPSTSYNTHTPAETNQTNSTVNILKPTTKATNLYCTHTKHSYTGNPPTAQEIQNPKHNQPHHKTKVDAQPTSQNQTNQTQHKTRQKEPQKSAPTQRQE